MRKIENKKNYDRAGRNTMNFEQYFKTHNLIFLCIVTAIIVISISFSRYESTIAGDNITKIAVMANTVSADLEMPISGYPGMNSIICPIVLTNKEQEKVCEVSQNYTIEIERQEIANIPLTFELYKDKYCTEIINCDENGIYAEEDFSFAAGIEETKTYYLRINWPKEQNDEYLAFEIEYFSINVIATQVD